MEEDVTHIYLNLRKQARNIVSTLPTPLFYRRFRKETASSRRMLKSQPQLIAIKKEIAPLVENDFGHGTLHSKLVSIDAGAIVQVELKNNLAVNKTRYSVSSINHQMVLVQAASLLHDIKRKEKNHSERGARFAKKILKSKNLSFTDAEIDIICTAIREHEAFTDRPVKKNKTGNLISNALYDADKFRWGVDNFTHTIWGMVIFADIPIKTFIQRYPGGMAKLEQIKGTFRTETGRKYGPDFIDQGIKTGKLLFSIIEKQFTEFI